MAHEATDNARVDESQSSPTESNGTPEESRRERSTVAPQALALMNGEFAVTQAEQFAARIKKAAGDSPEAQVESGWKMAFGRAPDATERQTALDYLGRNSLPRLCLLIFNMSEFIYVD